MSKKTMPSKKIDGYNTPFATNLRKLIDERDITQQKIAEVLDMSRQAVSKYANGSSFPDTEILIKLADYFKVSTDSLLGLNLDSTPETQIRKVCEYSGLTEKAIYKIAERYQEDNKLNIYFKLFNFFIEDGIYFDMITNILTEIILKEINNFDIERNGLLSNKDEIIDKKAYNLDYHKFVKWKFSNDMLEFFDKAEKKLKENTKDKALINELATHASNTKLSVHHQELDKSNNKYKEILKDIVTQLKEEDLV